MNDRSDRAEAVRKLLREARHAVLSTSGLEPAGYPYGSLVMLTTTARGEPAFLLSSLAQHTRNLEADPRASLLVTGKSGGEDPMQIPRAAVMGRARLLEEMEEAVARGALLERHPGAAMYFEIGFRLWALSPVEARYIGGFGTAAWVAGGELLGG